MEIFLIKTLQFILSISLLVLLHEGGHFFFSKLFGVRVEKFYIFFDPWFHLFAFKPKNSDTEYGIGWLPLGGYCKISGMIDESFDTEQMKQPAQPWEFRSKPAWQRLLIMIGGVLVNFLLALFIYAMILFHWGESYYDVKNMSMGMSFNKEAKALGFEDGDILISADGKEFKEFGGDLFRDISKAHEVVVKRDGKEVKIPLSGDLNLLNMLKADPIFARPFIPSEVDSVMPGSPALAAGIQKGDRITAIDGTEISSWSEFDDILGHRRDALIGAKSPADSLKLRTMSFIIDRKGQAIAIDSMVLTPDVRMGVYQSSVFTYYQPTKVSYGFFESLPAGVKYGWNVLKGYVSDMQYVFSSDGVKSLGGFGTIGGLFPATWDWYVFWRMTAFLSIILAFMNILPIPALDGGHVLFLLYEIITRRKPSEKFMLVAEYIGFAIILLLLLVANGNDVLRWLGIM